MNKDNKSTVVVITVEVVVVVEEGKEGKEKEELRTVLCRIVHTQYGVVVVNNVVYHHQHPIARERKNKNI